MLILFNSEQLFSQLMESATPIMGKTPICFCLMQFALKKVIKIQTLQVTRDKCSSHLSAYMDSTS